MSAQPTPADDYARLLALVADPYACYREPTPTLERILARTPALTHGRKTGDALLVAVEQLHEQIYATLTARARLDALEAEQARRAPQAARPPAVDGGTRVPTNPPRPGPLPPQRITDAERRAELEARRIEAGVL